MKKSRKIIAVLLSIMMVAGLAACSAAGKEDAGSDAKKTFKVGICNYVDDASLNQINDNIQNELKKIGEENNVVFDISYDNCNADANVLSQIVSNFIAKDVDLMVGIATPVAIAMQSATEDIPIIFSAVSDPMDAKLVSSLQAPGANITGTSDYLDTNAIMDLILANNPNTKTIGLLYDIGQDSSKTPIANAKKYLDAKGIKYIEHTATNDAEVQLAADAFVNDKVDAVFTPTDNTIMKAELSIYETFADAKIPHYTGADSFALNGAFLGYGVDYANLGVETAKMVAEVLIDGKKPAELAVKTFDNGTATVNTEICEKLGYSYADVEKKFAPYCTKVQNIKTAESFDAQ